MVTQRQKFLRELNEAFARSDMEFVLNHVTDNIIWNVIGAETVRGREAFRLTLSEMASPDPMILKIDTIITHGRTASVNGSMTASDGTEYCFCDVIKFRDSKSNMITEMTSYAIENKKT